MLADIAIRDFAIVERLALPFRPGMTVLTGETGAGKSVLVGALGLALGDRPESHMLRVGAEQTEIAVGFSLQDLGEVTSWLEERQLCSDNECLIRRIVSREGRSRAFVNDAPASAQALRDLGQMLVDIHGQHAHQSLLRRDVQRAVLDDFGGHGDLAARVGSAYREWQTARQALHQQRLRDEQRQGRTELLRHHLAELESLQLKDGELDALNGEHLRLANVHRLSEGAQAALDGLYERSEGAAFSVLQGALAELEQLQTLDPRLSGARELIAQGAVHLSEACAELRHYLGFLEPDPARLEIVERRLAAVHDLARKHRVDPEELQGLAASFAEELRGLDDTDAHLKSLERRVAAVFQEYQEQAAELSNLRRAAAVSLEEQVTRDMQRLGMPGGRFVVSLCHAEDPAASGAETVEFLVSANPGVEPMPLAKVASGGELARISLAIHVDAARTQTVPTLIFDEVDVGIGGRVAEVVGEHLRALAHSRQVVCITHLPQVAALGHHHLQVVKDTLGGDARVSIRYLSREERVEELARMSGGAKVTAKTVAHARDLLERGQGQPLGQP